MFRKVSIISTILLMVLLAGCSDDKSSSAGLPSHTVKRSSLGAKGNRVQINVTTTNITKEECITLVKQYKDQAKPNGQVSIYGPSPKLQKLFPNDPKANQPQCWAVDNLDGNGLSFNDLTYGGE